MKILVLSDSHGAMSNMRRAIDAVKPEAVIHLGDFYDDAATLAEEYSHIRFHHVVGNCDRFRCPESAPQLLCYDIGGVRFFMAHGHMHGVKSAADRLIADAKNMRAQAALYGHTHIADCRCDDGFWILNPGTCSHGEGSVGIIETDNGTIRQCQVLRLRELEG